MRPSLNRQITFDAIARRWYFKVAEVLVTSEMLTELLERMSGLGLAPGSPTLRAPVFMTVMPSFSANRLPQGSGLGRDRHSGLL